MQVESTVTMERPRPQRQPRTRWECKCSDPPVLLANYRDDGYVEIKVGDRHYLVRDIVHATCPTCGAQHILDLRPAVAS